MKNKIKIEMQYFRGCPNSEELKNRVRIAIKERGDEVDYKEILVENNELAQSIGFRGSPTLLINGVDLEDRPQSDSPALCCRVYDKGLPELDYIIKKIFG